MHWQDQGIVINSYPHGEQSVILTLLTAEHGLHGGLVRATKNNKVQLQLGTHHQVRWQARLSEHLGTWSLESLYSPLSDVIHDALKLSALTSACALVKRMIPERESHLPLFHALLALIKGFSENWLENYIHFEISLLEAGGFKLDFSKCAVTNSTENLLYVSPRSGKAVSEAAGEPYKEKLLALPSFVQSSDCVTFQQGVEALDLVSYFLKRYIFSTHDISMPAARQRFYQKLQNAI